MPDHDDHRALGYGNVDARPAIDGTPGTGGGDRRSAAPVMERDAHPLPPAEIEALKAAKPPRDSADDGKGGGLLHRGEPGRANFRGHDAAGHNAQTNAPSGSETERTAPGISTDKKADDTK